MNSENEELLSHRLEGLDALLVYLKGDDQKALLQLEGRTDSDAIKRKLQILVDSKKYNEAANAIRDQPVHLNWCDIAAFAFAMNSELEVAQGILKWAKKEADRLTIQRCLLAYAKARYIRALERIGLDRPILAGDLLSAEKDGLRDVVATLEPTIHTVLGQERIDTEIEVESVEVALHAASLTGDHSTSVRLSQFLKTRTPVPISLSRFADEHVIPIPQDLANRLRQEHPDSFNAQASAVMLDVEQGTDPQQTLLTAKALMSLTVNEAQRESLARILNDIAQRIDQAALDDVDAIMSATLSPENRFRQLTFIDRLLRRDELDKASTELERLKDEQDPYWLQLYANYRLHLGDGRSAADYFAQASQVFPHPQLLRMAASLSLDVGRLSIACTALERLISREPDAIPELKQLGLLYIRQKLSTKAAAVFSRLQNLQPKDPAHLNNYALSLWQSGDFLGALKAFELLCGKLDVIPLSVILSKAELLRDLNRPNDAFDWLLKYKDAHWDDYRYVQIFMDMGFAAQREDLAHNAMMHLEALQTESKAPSHVLQRKTLDDLKEFIQKSQEASDSASKLLLDNRLPWLLCDKAQRRPAYLAWKIRTQPLNWLPDDPIARSNFTVYATNNFFVSGLGTSDATLKEVVAPPPETTVVIDISSLITLSELDLLAEAIRYFGQAKIPAMYMSTAVSDLKRLQLHQPSRRSSLQELQGAIRSKKVYLLEDIGVPGARPLPYLHEHTLEEENSEHYYRLIDAVNAMEAAGLLSESTRRSLIGVSHKGSGVNEEHPALGIGANVLFDLSTMLTICQVGGLSAVTRSLKCCLPAAAEDLIDQELSAYTEQDDLLRRHSQLWDFVRANERIQQVGLEFPPDTEDRSDDATVPIASSLLAEEEDLPLYADDRVLQSVSLNAHSSRATRAFGTDALLFELFSRERIGIDKYFQSVMRLLEWRYRFLVPTPGFLVEAAFRFLTHPPGDDLMRVAQYFHECMADPGVLIGFEPTDPPISIAARLFLSLTAVVIEFLIDVWTDSRFSEESARTLTRWALTEMLPSPPRKMRIQGSSIASLSKRLVVSRALIRGCTKRDVERASTGIAAIAEGMEIPEDEFWRIASEVIGGRY